MELTFDGDPATTQTVRVTEDEQVERFELDPQPAKTVKFEITDWEPNGDRDIIGLENIALYAERSPDFLERVKPLLNIGTLVQYPMGEGGILLNQVKVMDREPLPINVQKKKAVVATLLQNLGAAFSGQRVVLPGEGLNYEPISMENHANLYITSDLGWPHNQYDLAHLPLDNTKFAGVPYDIRNFETSPLESAVTVGRWRDIQAPEKITGMQVNRTGDALFFLHTMFEHRQWRPNRGQNIPPVVWQYVVHYADGQTETVPVRYGEGAAHFVQSNPKGLKNAALAWAAPFPDDPENEAAIYAMQWNNPRPDVEIESIDLVQGEGSRHGAPVLLGITVANVID
jgi:beta-galactosidase